MFGEHGTPVDYEILCLRVQLVLGEGIPKRHRCFGEVPTYDVIIVCRRQDRFDRIRETRTLFQVVEHVTGRNEVARTSLLDSTIRRSSLATPWWSPSLPCSRNPTEVPRTSRTSTFWSSTRRKLIQILCRKLIQLLCSRSCFSPASLFWWVVGHGRRTSVWPSSCGRARSQLLKMKIYSPRHLSDIPPWDLATRWHPPSTILSTTSCFGQPCSRGRETHSLAARGQTGHLIANTVSTVNEQSSELRLSNWDSILLKSFVWKIFRRIDGP